MVPFQKTERRIIIKTIGETESLRVALSKRNLSRVYTVITRTWRARDFAITIPFLSPVSTYPRVYATVCRMLPNLDADHEESTRCPLKNSTNETSLSLFDTISSRERKEAKLLLRSERRCSEVVAPKARGFQTSRIKRRRSRCAEERHPVRGATVSTGRNNWGYRYLAARLSRLAPPPPPRDGGEFLGKVSDSTGTN